jgi:uncharacterized membrane protein YfcA
MNLAKILLFGALAAANLAYFAGWARAIPRHKGERGPTLADMLIGFGTDFLDALGIGSFAPTTAIYTFRGNPPEELIPGTLNIGHNAAAIAECLIFVAAVPVDPVLLVASIGTAGLGAWLGAGVVSRLPRRAIQLAIGVALLIAGAVFAATNLGWLPAGGTAMTLVGWKFWLAISLNGVFGALMSVGIGLYAPCMIMLALLGLHPLGAFPIMMGACGLVQPLASLRFFESGRFAWGPTLGLFLGGGFGVLLAAFVVKSLPLVALRWLVVGVVLYAAWSLLRAFRDSKGEEEEFFLKEEPKTFTDALAVSGPEREARHSQ